MVPESKEGKQKRMIEFFKEPNIDWMGKAKYFFALSAILLLAGWFSIWQKGGLYYGIDFKGGTNVDVRFAQAPNIDQLRKSLSAQGLGGAEIQAISDSGLPGQASNEVLIFVEQKEGTEDQALDANKARVIAALNATYTAQRRATATRSSRKKFSTIATRPRTASSRIFPIFRKLMV